MARTDRQSSSASAPGLEPLEPRMLLSSSPMLAGIGAQRVLAGSPLYIPLKTTDADGDPITYTVTSSNPAVVSTYIPRNNRSLRIDMAGGGTMTFQLFEDKAPRATARIIELANSGFYDGLTFHRVIDSFMIQGGDPEGTGMGGSGQQFDDQFHPDLQHNRAGLLSMAKSGDDTNDSQFFITDASYNYPRWLDFNHTIFGLQTGGEAVRDAISSVPVGANDRPVTSQVMENVTVFNDRQNGVLMLKVPANVTAGTSTITVTAHDGTGRISRRQFVVRAAPDPYDNAPYLNPIPTLRTERGEAFSFRMTSVDVDGGTRYYDAALGANAPQGVTGQINRQNGTVTLTPPAGYTGTFDLTLKVRDVNGQAWDEQRVQVEVVPPVAPDAWDVGPGDDVVSSSRFIPLNRWQFDRTIDSKTDHDWVRFTIPQTSRVIVRALGENATDVRLYLRGPNNPNAIPSAPNSAVAAEGAQQTALVRAGLRALPPGTYWVRVDGMGIVVPQYHLKVEVAALPAVAAADGAVHAAALWHLARRQDATDREPAGTGDTDVLLESEPVLEFLA